jgi:hypothetical protein
VKILFALNTIFELGVAIASAFLLNSLILAGNALGFTVLSGLMLMTNEPKQLRIGLITFSVFHTAITLAWIITAFQSGFNPAAIGHGLFASAFWFFTIKNLTQKDDNI